MAPYTEDDGRQALMDRRGHLTRNIFAGCKLGFTVPAVADYVAFSAMNAYSIKTGISGAQTAVATGAPAATTAVGNFVNEIFNVADLKAFMASAVVPHGIAQTVENFVGVLPGVASVQSGLMALVHLGKAATHAWAKIQVESKEGSLRSGDPRAALGAVARVLSRAQSASEAKAAINAGHAAASAAGFFVDGGLASGPALGALKALASLSFRMFLLGRDLKEKSRGNKLLADPHAIDSSVFGAAPILGCYIITESSAFDILNFLVGEIGQAGWMTKVEALIPDMVYVQDLAAQYAREASLHVSGLKTDMWQFRGLTRSERLKRWLKRKVGVIK